MELSACVYFDGALLHRASYRNHSRKKSAIMPRLVIGTFEVEKGRRLVKAIGEAGVDVGHRCGGQARCTTCRVRFQEGEPDEMTRAEYLKLSERDLLGQFRLSCQILAEDDMKVEVLMRAQEAGWADAGPEPADEIEPQPDWISRSDAGLES